jgi:cullin 3
MECGYQFTSKLEGMFTDMRISKDIMDAFNSQTSTSEGSGPTLHVQVLTSTFWPVVAYMEANSNINYPREISTLMNRFEKFYLSRHSGRKISWLPHMGTADMRVHFEKGRKEINVNILGMIVLTSLFNGSYSEPISFQTIQEVTSIPTSDLIRTLQSLSLGKYRILLKSTKGKQIAPADTFTFNSQFTAPLTKIKIPTISSGNTMTLNGVENDEERLRTLEKVDEARKHQVEAAIVRIMKSRKSMDHSNLVAEVIDQLKSRFIPSPAMVKKRIEGLIEREYLDRDKEDMKKYVYLA